MGEKLENLFYLEAMKDISLKKLILENRNKISIAIDLIKDNHSRIISWDEVDINDQKVYQTIRDFPFIGLLENLGEKEFLSKIIPFNFEELIAMFTLVKIDSDEVISDYIENKNGRKYIYIFEFLEEVLESTHGLILYEEQIIEIINEFNNDEVQVMYKIIKDKEPIALEKSKDKFIECASSQGYWAKSASELFDSLVQTSKYTLEKSNLIPCASMTFQIAWIKTYYSNEFSDVFI